MENTWKTGGTVQLAKETFRDLIVHANSDTEAEMDIGEIWFDAANDVYKGKNSVEVFQFAIQSDVDALQSDLTTLTDRVAVQTDTDGHGKMSYLKEQTTEPTPGTDEGVIYTADDGGDTVLYYKANGEVVELARPGLSPMLGYVKGLVPSIRSNDELYINPGIVEINGTLCELPLKAAIDVKTMVGGSFTEGLWYIICISAPTSGATLTSSNFSIVTAPPSFDVARLGRYTAADARVINRVRASSTTSLDSSQIWSGACGEHLEHAKLEVFSNTAPTANITTVTVNAPVWGSPIRIGGEANVQGTTIGYGMELYNGNNGEIGRVRVLSTESHTYQRFEATTDSSMEIGYAGNPSTYTAFEAHATSQSLPSDI